MAPKFDYRAKDTAGNVIKGSMKAESRIDVAESLQKQNLYIIEIVENNDLDFKKILSFFHRVSLKELALFSRQFAVLLNAGVPIIQCIDILRDQTEHKGLKQVLSDVYNEVEVGTSFSLALDKHADTFPPMYARMVRAGESGGILDNVMRRLAEHYERENEIRSRVRSAMAYPIVVLIVAVAVVAFLMIMVIPTFANLFSTMGGTLPLPTRIVMGTSTLISHYWYLFILAIVMIIVSVSSYLKTSRGKFKLHRFQLKVPVLGQIMVKMEVARFARTLGNLLHSGVSLTEALQIVERVINNDIIANALIDARLKVQEGTRLSEPLINSNLFPRMMTQMIVVGEETGTMDEMLEEVADFYDQEAENAVKTAVSLLEPAMIIFVAVIVGFIVISIVLPMFNMIELF